MKIYTRKGDKGETGLIGGTRVPKSTLRVETYGEVDELNAVLGWVRVRLTDEMIRADLVQIQRDLFAIGAQLADPRSGLSPTPIGEPRKRALPREGFEGWKGSSIGTIPC